MFISCILTKHCKQHFCVIRKFFIAHNLHCHNSSSCHSCRHKFNIAFHSFFPIKILKKVWKIRPWLLDNRHDLTYILLIPIKTRTVKRLSFLIRKSYQLLRIYFLLVPYVFFVFISSWKRCLSGWLISTRSPHRIDGSEEPFRQIFLLFFGRFYLFFLFLLFYRLFSKNLSHNPLFLFLKILKRFL